MAEWSKATVSKIVISFWVSRVQIPLSPPFFLQKKWRTKTEVFSSLCEAQLHSKGVAFSSLPRRNEMKPGHLHQKREALLACPAIARRATVDEVAPLACHGVICGADEDG